MKRIDKIKGGTVGDVAEILCDLVQEAFFGAEEKYRGKWVPYPCDACPASRTCRVGNCGFMDWLQEEATER